MKTSEGLHRQFACWLLVALLCFAPALFAQKGKKGDDAGGGTRSVQGSVTSAENAPQAGAVVFLKNTKSLQIRSFISKEDGTYYFNGLSPDVDYELRAEYQGISSPSKTLSTFDSRKEAIINLKLNKK
ncbi:MAG: carboxypeptidase regulatory-like domain-containing protein [Acidobacteriia bacterium]|nr:carboxypeptidase regulatory-like domain-containing protein [Terriglobia bacterium]